ncbi:hypothetical protein IET37_001017 [Enterococcus faecalis]|uniref:hypothetical protein n=1 Tax=Enterococcus gallinarum TaxID=1353 RepID=UPI0012E1D496|nr:hypothetical protein [Enterococcus gallinarum]EGO2636706.1 hypothetical protein [Enterococcus faecalis]MUN91419.1 hypothetical protein [Enterococcus gallinarum]
MTNGTSQGLFVIIAIIIFGIFIAISYLLFRNTLQPSLSTIFNDSLEQTEDYLTGVTNQKYFIYSKNNGSGVSGLKPSAYNENGTIKPRFKTIHLPNKIQGKNLYTLDFVSSFDNFKGIEKIIGNSTLNKVTPLGNKAPNLVELDLSQTKVNDLGVQYFLKDNKTVKKLILSKEFNKFGYGAFQNSALEELVLTNTTPISDIQYIATAPRKQLTVKAPKELESQIKPYESSLKEVIYY